MKVMVIVKASKASEAGEMPDRELLAAMGKFNEDLVDAGIMVAGEGLHPTARGVRVHYSDGARKVVTGPFDRPTDQIAGFWVWRVNSMEEALKWAMRCPKPHDEDCDLELRPIFEAEDFGEAMTPELRDQEERLRVRTEQAMNGR